MKNFFLTVLIPLTLLLFTPSTFGDSHNVKTLYLSKSPFRTFSPRWSELGDKETQGSYEGEVDNRKPHGQGTWTHPDGRKYVGEWEDGFYHGQGTFTYPDGEKLQGEWVDGRLYEGEWVDGLRHGQGTWTHPDGDKYVGEWKDGEKHGQGTFTSSDGDKYVGEWKDGRRWNGKQYFQDGKIIRKVVKGLGWIITR